MLCISVNVQKYTEIQQKIKANFILVSRSRFKVLVPYNNNVIEIFKKMTSKSYGNILIRNWRQYEVFNLFLLQMQRLPHGVLVLKITTHLVRFIHYPSAHA